ncbi:unnamed protein product [Rhizoctonia solani]|uniref:Protein kinase domain-containing protein n=1 Tax=Rhizoctonia solani TaxID=456999 RepID=A0A8H3D9R3_9AGAM|nr:unnamed protein product [Rhizoctonia solani]
MSNEQSQNDPTLPSTHRIEGLNVSTGPSWQNQNVLYDNSGQLAFCSTPISRAMTIPEVVSHLVVHGCQNLTDALNHPTFSQHPVSHGGFSDVYCGRLLNATQVAVKALRVSIQSIAENPKHLKCIQICEGLSHLHEIEIIHGDLKGANILISNDGTPVLTDFGNSIHTNQSMKFTQTTSERSWTMRWTAPELILGSGSQSKAADVYALAMVSVSG